MPKKTYNKSAWSLKKLFAQPGEVDKALEKLDAGIRELETLRPTLKSNIPGEEFLALVKRLDDLQTQSGRLYAYAGLGFAANTQDQKAQALVARIEQFLAESANRTLFFSLWWKDLGDKDAKRLMKDAGDYRYWLEEMRHFRPHTLSEAEEKILNIKNVTGPSALERLYDAMTNRYTFRVRDQGTTRELTRGELMVYVRQADPKLRKAAYQELYRVYGQDGPILGQIYQTLARDWRNEHLQLRNYASPISARNLANDIPDEVIDTLLEVCRANTAVFQRFFRLKARVLGMKKLRRYDVYAPVAGAEKRYSFADAAAMVLDSFREFDPSFARLAERVFADGHLDSEVRKGKRGGAFCWSVQPGLTPWVLVNYQGRADDVSTLAHELGHAIHSMLAGEHTIFTYHSNLPLAETASTFGEMMLVDKLLAGETDEAVRRDILFGQVDDAYATIQRQAFFALFEKQAHEMISQNASVDEIVAAYLENLRTQFGDAVDVADEFRWEWVSIPHIYASPFYVYAYAFGQLLVFALYSRYKREGEGFKPLYRELLSAGGSKSPASVLQAAGIDMRQASFWQGGYDVISGLVDQLEALG